MNKNILIALFMLICVNVRAQSPGKHAAIDSEVLVLDIAGEEAVKQIPANTEAPAPPVKKPEAGNIIKTKRTENNPAKVPSATSVSLAEVNMAENGADASPSDPTMLFVDSSYKAATQPVAAAKTVKKPASACCYGEYEDGIHSYYRCHTRACEGHAPALGGKDDYYIVVEKSKYTLSVFNAAGELMVKYPVVFGKDDLGDKMYEGDHETPEGIFHIAFKKEDNRWSKFMLLDYPSKDSWQKFNERKKNGLIPQGAHIGQGVGIHGTLPHDDESFLNIDRKYNWTNGCVSTKDSYIDELYSFISVGTKVIIRK